MMIDNPDGFHDAIREALEDHREWKNKKK
jgi:hypothetical protein